MIEVLRRPIESTQYTSCAFTKRRIDAGIEPSIGSVGDAYDDALAETTIGLFKTEMIVPNGPWRTVSDIELATLTWVDWYNNRMLYGACGDVPPVEYEICITWRRLFDRANCLQRTRSDSVQPQHFARTC